MRTTELFADAIRLIRQEGLDPVLQAEYGMCGNLLHYSKIRNEMLTTYSHSDLKKAAAHAQHFVFQIMDDLGLDADERMYEYLYGVLMQKHSPESAMERWFLIYEDWENRYDYVY